jgi:hypothetical protein
MKEPPLVIFQAARFFLSQVRPRGARISASRLEFRPHYGDSGMRLLGSLFGDGGGLPRFGCPLQPLLYQALGLMDAGVCDLELLHQDTGLLPTLLEGRMGAFRLAAMPVGLSPRRVEFRFYRNQASPCSDQRGAELQLIRLEAVPLTNHTLEIDSRTLDSGTLGIFESGHVESEQLPPNNGPCRHGGTMEQGRQRATLIQSLRGGFPGEVSRPDIFYTRRISTAERGPDGVRVWLTARHTDAASGFDDVLSSKFRRSHRMSSNYAKWRPRA